MPTTDLVKFTGIKAVFFDTAETLYASPKMEEAYPVAINKLVAETRGISVDEAEILLKKTKQKLEQTTTEHVTKVRTMAELGFSRSQVHEAFFTVNPKDFLSPDPALAAMMAKLTQVYRLGIISNFKASHVKDILAALGLRTDWFKVFVTEDVVTEIKPSFEPFLKAIELAGCKPEECLYIGDSYTKDMQPAKAVGMQTVLVDTTAESKSFSFADSVITNVKQIVGFLDFAS